MASFRVFLKGSLLSAVAGFFAAGVVMVGQSSEADATLMLRLSSGTQSFTATDTDDDGIVSFSGAVGTFIANFTAGFSKPVLGSATAPEIDLLSGHISGSQAGSITVEITDTDFVFTGPRKKFNTSIGGTLDDTFNYMSFVDDSNTAFGQGTKVADLAFSSGGVNNAHFGGAASGIVSLTGAYSVTMVGVITHSAPGQNTSLDGTITVDEPGTLALLGIGLVGLGLAARRRQRSKA